MKVAARKKNKEVSIGAGITFTQLIDSLKASNMALETIYTSFVLPQFEVNTAKAKLIKRKHAKLC